MVFALGMLSGEQLLFLLILAMFIFGARRLPEVGRSLGQSIVAFKKGLKGVEDDLDDHPSRPRGPGDERMAEAPKFDMAGEPRKEASRV